MKKTPANINRSTLGIKDTSAHTQRLQVVSLLTYHQSMSTPEFRQFGIMAPAPRIFELRQQGHRIEKVLESYTDDTGKTHHGVARYYFANNPPANDNHSEAVA